MGFNSGFKGLMWRPHLNFVPKKTQYFLPFVVVVVYVTANSLKVFRVAMQQ